MSEARRRRGRHARAAETEPAGDDPGGPDPGGVRLPPGLASRRTRVTLAGVAGAVLTAALALAAALPDHTPRAAVGAPARRPPMASPALAVTPRSVSESGDAAALAYYRRADAGAARHVGSVVWSGPMLRVYTDLPSSDANSRTAIALCDTAATYLVRTGREPIVFVHARGRDGYQVLANKTAAGDDCRLDNVP